LFLGWAVGLLLSLTAGLPFSRALDEFFSRAANLLLSRALDRFLRLSRELSVLDRFRINILCGYHRRWRYF